MNVYLTESIEGNSGQRFLSERCQEHVFRYKRGTASHFTGYILASYALRYEGYARAVPIDFRWTVDGMPYVEGADCRMSISHSGNIAIASVSRNSIGIDVERERKIDLDFAKSFLTAEEWTECCAIKNQRSKNDYLLAHWCLKEAYLKCSGTINIFSFDKIYLAKQGNIYSVGDRWFGKVKKTKYGYIAVGSSFVDEIKTVRVKKVTHKRINKLLGELKIG